MRVMLFFCLTLFTANLCAQNKYICITVDDLPTVTYGQNNDKIITDKLIQSFIKFKIPAIGYVNEAKLYTDGKIDSSKIDLLRMWLESGNDLGNHTYSHLDFNTVEDSVYFNDILNGGIITGRLMNEYGKELRYFRHPFLHTGMNESRNTSLENFLKQHHYTSAPVTIDNDDYLFARFYNQAFLQKDDSLMIKIGNCYVDYMEKKLIYFEQKSNEVFGKAIAQTLLIHASLLNADFMDELAIMYQKHNYKFISQKKVLRDKAYKSPDNYFTKRGISWIYRWGFTKGMNESMTTGDITTPEYIINMSNEY
ncbi:polysaccharide deacetylase family protein [Sporocytophaga myxococcoides]|uniref:polysaccharide deacetylase family protein n=1 Tax=Sporocytophaga myxococcoides TaxID=153721 RepID=UPI0003F4D8A3|nr:polysaccharide deacetylase family protein [Sporocytophaga myxococcoides]